jgi:aryl-alcohol dehydrogenase-like predicted oxidoreductase
MPENDWRKRDHKFMEPALTKNLAIAETLRSIGRKHDCSAGEAAIAWTLRNPAVSGAIVGGRSAAQVEGIRKAWDVQLTPDDLAELEEEW